MLAFLRVMVFYLGFTALLVWGMFALGLADALELPGFEGARAPTMTPPVKVAAHPVPEAMRPEPQVKREPLVETTRPRAPAPVEAAPEPPPAPKRVVIDVPPPAPPAAAPVAAPARTEVTAAAPQIPLPSPLPPAPRIEARIPDPVARPAPPAPPVPPPVANVAPVVPPPVAAPKLQPQARAPAAPVATPKSWVPVHRIAGFGAAGLAQHLAEKRRARDDIACVMFRNVVFKGGTTIYRPGARADLEQIAKVLRDNPGGRVELGSRLGPGRPMATDAKLRTDRAELVRNTLISLGVAPARLAIDTREAYERVAEDVGRVDGGRIQSMGVCILTT